MIQEQTRRFQDPRLAVKEQTDINFSGSVHILEMNPGDGHHRWLRIDGVNKYIAFYDTQNPSLSRARIMNRIREIFGVRARNYKNCVFMNSPMQTVNCSQGHFTTFDVKSEAPTSLFAVEFGEDDALVKPNRICSAYKDVYKESHGYNILKADFKVIQRPFRTVQADRANSKGGRLQITDAAPEGTMIPTRAPGPGYSSKPARNPFLPSSSRTAKIRKANSNPFLRKRVPETPGNISRANPYIQKKKKISVTESKKDGMGKSTNPYKQQTGIKVKRSRVSRYKRN
jgi:hypothetical protein